MKTFSIIAVTLTLPIFLAQGQTVDNASVSSQPAQSSLPAATPYQIVDVGADHRTWQRNTFQLGPDGEVVTNVHQYVELTSGLYYQNNGHWTESQELIEPSATGAVAQRGSHKVIFANT